MPRGRQGPLVGSLMPVPEAPARDVTGRRRVEPWEQQPRETAQYFRYFMMYLTMDRLDRSLVDAYRIGHGHQITDTHIIPPPSWYPVARRWKWEDRALAYDREQDRVFLKRFEKRRQTSLLEIADLGEMFRKKAALAAKLITTVTQSLGVHDGREVMVMKADLTPDQIVRLAECGVKLEQLALGNPTERTAHQFNDDALKNMTDEQLAEVAAGKVPLKLVG